MISLNSLFHSEGHYGLEYRGVQSIDCVKKRKIAGQRGNGCIN